MASICKSCVCVLEALVFCRHFATALSTLSLHNLFKRFAAVSAMQSPNKMHQFTAATTNHEIGMHFLPLWLCLFVGLLLLLLYIVCGKFHLASGKHFASVNEMRIHVYPHLFIPLYICFFVCVCLCFCIEMINIVDFLVAKQGGTLTLTVLCCSIYFYCCNNMLRFVGECEMMQRQQMIWLFIIFSTTFTLYFRSCCHLFLHDRKIG